MTQKVLPVELLAAVIADHAEAPNYVPGGVTLKTGFGSSNEPSRFDATGGLKTTVRVRQFNAENAGSHGLYYVLLDVGIAQSRHDDRDAVPSHVNVVRCAEWIRGFVIGGYDGQSSVHNSRDHVGLSSNGRWRTVGLDYDMDFANRPIFTTAFYYHEEEESDAINDAAQFEYASVKFLCSYIQ